VSHPLRPFYFTVVFWGSVYREYFTDLLLASLLSPNNIPALNKSRRNKFLIVTTREDWQALQGQPMFERLRQYLEPEWIEMPFPQSHELKMLVMSRGHKQVATRAFEDQAYGVFVTPDLILSDGSVAAMERLAEAGKKVVLSVAIRFRHETLLAEMDSEGYLKPGEPMAISSRDLMRLALGNLHSETLRYEFDASYFADCPVSLYWWVPDGSGMIIYSFSWAPLIVDYGALQDHDTRTFEDWTLDGDYIYRNFPDHENVYVVTDSDEIALVSFTKEADLHFDLVPKSQMQYGELFSTAYKIGLIRSLWKSSVMDPLKRAIFAKPVYLHSAEVDENWSKKRLDTDVLIEKSLRPSTLEERFISDVCATAGQSRFADWVLRRFSDASQTPNSDRIWFLTIRVWLIVVCPRRIVGRVISGLLQPVMRVASIGYWFWRYRRFVWWRAKEKLRWVEERHYKWTDPHWAQPGVSLVCPMFTLRWMWRYRRYVWWRAKEKLGLVKERHYKWTDAHWAEPGVSLVCPLFTLRWMWRNRLWLVRHRKSMKETLNLLQAGSMEKKVGRSP
jgi:hypothetical protein